MRNAKASLSGYQTPYQRTQAGEQGFQLRNLGALKPVSSRRFQITPNIETFYPPFKQVEILENQDISIRQ